MLVEALEASLWGLINAQKGFRHKRGGACVVRQ